MTLASYITGGNITCDNTVDGICTLPAACSDYAAITEYYFIMNFTNEVNGNYMRVPLAAFAETSFQGYGSSVCNLYVNYLDSSAAQSSAVIMGGMWFQEFFGIFVNDYNNIETPDQSATLYVGKSSMYNGYVGNEVLPIGVNPFKPPTPPTPPAESSGLSAVWIVVIVLICACLVGFLAFLLYKYKSATDSKNVRGSNVVYGTDGKVNASDAPNASQNISPEEKQLLDV